MQCERRRGTALCPWPAPAATVVWGGGAQQRSSPLSPAPSPSLPHLTVLAGVHGRAQGAAEVFDKVPGVAEGADDTVLVGAVGVGHQPFVGALGRPDGAPHLAEPEQPQGWGPSIPPVRDGELRGGSEQPGRHGKPIIQLRPTCAKPTKKSWWLVSPRAGRRFSSPFFCSQDL